MKSSELNEIEERAADWVAERDRCDGRLAAERQAELDRWLNASPAHRVAFLRLDQAWQRADRLRALQSPAPVFRSPSPKPRRSGWAWPWRPSVRWAAAGLSLTVVMATLVFNLNRAPATLEYATERGQRESVMLTDGSQLTLNTATRLRTAVTAQVREVWLEHGEAFFDVAHDAQRPFVVHAGKQTVTVLGTRFSLYREGDQLRVTVAEGRVKVQAQRSQPTVLTRADVALADATHVLVTKQSSEQLAASLGWLQGQLIFNDVSLAEAARQFNRYGRKQLVIQDEAAARISIGGVFGAVNVEGFARLLHVGFGLQVQVKDDEILISSPRS